ncbi:MAG: 7-cyano-7-deazaguanine synthase [Vicinamibacterales bacterium]
MTTSSGQHEPPASAAYAGERRVAVLCSAGLDSAVLVADLARSATVQPVYVSVGLAWEATERLWLSRLLAAPAYRHGVLPVAELGYDMRDVYPPTHWALTGHPPAYDTPDEDVYIAGRNVVLLTKAAVFCAHRRIHEVAIGPLAGNPFPDATPAFFSSLAHAFSLGLDHRVAILAPYLTRHKEDVIRTGHALGVPFDLTLSCMSPTDGRHCGECSKCRERRDAFAAAGVDDPTPYAASEPANRPGKPEVDADRVRRGEG